MFILSFRVWCDKQSATLARALWQLGAVSACSAAAFWVLQSDGGGVGCPSRACSAGQLSSAQLGLLRSAAQRSSDRRSACRTEMTARNGSWAALSVFMARAHSYVEQQSLAKGVLPGLPTSFKSPNLRTRNYLQGLSSMKNHHHYYKRDGATLLRCRKH